MRVESEEAFAAGNVEVAAERAQHAVQPDRRGARYLLVGDRRPGNHAGLSGGVEARRVDDQFRLHAGDGGDAVHRILAHTRAS